MKQIKVSANKNGIAAGIAYNTGKKDIAGAMSSVKKAATDITEAELSEIERFNRALEKAKKHIESSVNNEMVEVLTSYKMMLEDEAILNPIKDMLSESEGRKVTAEEAIHECVKHVAKELSLIKDDYIKSRADDVEAAFNYVLEELSGNSHETVNEPVILFGEKLMPTDIADIDKSLLLALVTGEGSSTSHLAILAKGMGIPYVCTGPSDYPEVADGTKVIVDTEAGIITIDPDDKSFQEATAKMKERLAASANAAKELINTELPVRLYANISGPKDLDEVINNHAEGIGLYRSEFLFLNRDSAPGEEEQFEAYKKVVEGMQGKEVIIRTSDIGTDKVASYMNLEHEENPALGKRAIRISLTEPDEFRVQLKALLRAACFGNEAIMYPMITSVSELEMIKEQVDLAVKELTDRGEEYKIPRQGIMIETPAAAMISDELAKHVDFFSIGSNDLTQYTLAIDRQAAGLDIFYNPLHEGLMRMIEITAKNAHDAGITTAVCGELGNNKDAVPRLIKAGVDELSMSPALIPEVRRFIAELDIESDKISAPTDIDANSGNTTAEVHNEEFGSPADGKLIPMDAIPDQVFASGALGQCIGVEPDNGSIYAPCDGTVITVAKTLHAIAIQSECGFEVLIHVGIDTVKMEGKGFDCKVEVGQKVKKGDLILTADIDEIKKEGYSPIVIMAVK